MRGEFYYIKVTGSTMKKVLWETSTILRVSLIALVFGVIYLIVPEPVSIAALPVSALH